ncbi:MAG: transporter, partial [Planctomycetes bacterium]|nr:transporter [Planctomycetota bacterium]
MSSNLTQTLLYSAVPVGTMIAGGAVAAFRPPGKKVTSGIQHFAAGVVFAVVAAELLPDVRKQHAPWEMAVSFGLGVAVMLALRVLATRLEKRSGAGGLPWGLLGAIGIDVLIDGLILGVGFAVGGSAGLLLTIALGVELLSLGLATAAETVGRTGGKKGLTIGAVVGLAVVFAAGALGGGTALQGLSKEWLSMVLSFGCAALLYLVTEELLVEAHEGAESRWVACLFFVGFLVIFLL